MSSLYASIKRIRYKAIEKRWRHHFPHYKSMGAFCCHRNQSFHPICPKTLGSLSPITVMLHIKFDQGWPTGFRDIQVWKCGRRRTDGRTDDDGQLVYYKLTLWAFGWGELKSWLNWLKKNKNAVKCHKINCILHSCSCINKLIEENYIQPLNATCFFCRQLQDF